MAEIQITLKDGSKRSVQAGATLLEIVKGLSNSLAKSVLAAKVDGKVVDLTAKLEADAAVEFLTFADKEGRHALRHSASHVLAQAVKRLYKNVELAIGPAIENGFYYDFDAETPFTPEDLDKIQKEMEKIVKENLPITREELPREEAIRMFEAMGERYKVELIRDLPEDAVISLYRCV